MGPLRLEDLRRVHIIGVGGTLMGAFAAFLKRRGIDVSGSDNEIYPPMSDVLADAGVRLFKGYKAENLQMASPGGLDLVVVGNVVRSDNPEARKAIDGGYIYSSLPEAMEKLLLPATKNIVVAGTHGKTTTSALMAHVLNCCGLAPSYFIGGVVPDLPGSFFVNPDGKYFVLEGDEYDTAFWDKVPKFNHYLPDDAILTSVEFDHADIYPDFEAVKKAFDGFVTRIRPGGRLICCADYPAAVEVSKKCAVPVITYGSRPAAGVRYYPDALGMNGQMYRFRLMDDGRPEAELELAMAGMHNVLNAISVWIECQGLGLGPDAVSGAMKSFRGVKRRQEVRGEVRGVLVIDDFAHHPTAVRETLRAIRARYPGRRIIAVFEPRSATSRRKFFQNQYAGAFDEADAAFIAVPFDQGRIPEDDQFSSDQLVSDIRSRSRSRIAELMKTVDEGVGLVARHARQGDLVAVFSNGGFGGFIPRLLDALEGKTENG